MTERRVVITGMGVVAPGGIGTKQFWDLLTSGRTATRRITLFDPSGFRSQIAAECDFDPVLAGLDHQEIRRMDRVAQFAVVAAREALADSGLTLDELPVERTGVAIGSAVGCTMRLEDEYVVLSNGGQDWLAIAVEVAGVCQAEGPVALISTGCTSGLDAVAHGVALIREGTCDVVMAGASDAPLSPITSACFDAIKATSPNNGDAEHASRPFDRDRDGFVLGEGSAMFMLEDLGRAIDRGANIYAEIAGAAHRGNAYHMTGLKPDGREMAEAITHALAQAKLDPSRIDYINAHGSGTLQNDRHETAAFKRSLGYRAHDVPISSIKSMIGHSLGAIGSIEIAACALAITHGVVPPTANLHNADPECDLDYVPLVSRQQRTDTVLTVGSGFGGFQTAMVLTRLGRP
jgi:act minimal PKS ketosynthase (KS/KS alpha)